jgi:hypothetical protein
MIGVTLTVLLLHGTLGLVKLWSARHATHDGIDGLVGSAAQVVL